MAAEAGLDALDGVDPEKAIGARLPEPYRSIASLVDSTFEASWALLERSHPELCAAESSASEERRRELARPARPSWSHDCGADDAAFVIPVMAGTALLVARRSTLELVCEGGTTTASTLDTGHHISAVSTVVDGTVAVVCRSKLSIVRIAPQGLEVVATLDGEEEEEEIVHVVLLSASAVCVSSRARLSAHEVTAGEAGEEALKPLWELKTTEALIVVAAAPHEEQASRLLVCRSEGSARCTVLDDAGRVVMRWTAPAPISAASLAKGRIAVGLATGLVVAIEPALGLVDCLQRHQSAVVGLDCSANYIVSLDAAGVLHIYDAATGALLRRRDHDDLPTHDVSLHAFDSAPIAAVRLGSTVAVYDLKTQCGLGSLELPTILCSSSSSNNNNNNKDQTKGDDDQLFVHQHGDALAILSRRAGGGQVLGLFTASHIAIQLKQRQPQPPPQLATLQAPPRGGGPRVSSKPTSETTLAKLTFTNLDALFGQENPGGAAAGRQQHQASPTKPGAAAAAARQVPRRKVVTGAAGATPAAAATTAAAAPNPTTDKTEDAARRATRPLLLGVGPRRASGLVVEAIADALENRATREAEFRHGLASLHDRLLARVLPGGGDVGGTSRGATVAGAGGF